MELDNVDKAIYDLLKTNALKPNQLAKKLNKQRTAISRSLRKLRNLNIVTIFPSPDKRERFYTVTKLVK